MIQKVELPVISNAKNICRYIITIKDKLSKKFRLTMVSGLQKYRLDVIELLITANDIYITQSCSVEVRQRSNLR